MSRGGRLIQHGLLPGLLHPPEAEGVAVDGVRFCVRAVDPLSGATSLTLEENGFLRVQEMFRKERWVS